MILAFVMGSVHNPGRVFLWRRVYYVKLRHYPLGSNIDEDPEKVLFFTQPWDGIVLGGTWAGCKLHEFKRPVNR